MPGADPGRSPRRIPVACATRWPTPRSMPLPAVRLRTRSSSSGSPATWPQDDLRRAVRAGEARHAQGPGHRRRDRRHDDDDTRRSGCGTLARQPRAPSTPSSLTRLTKRLTYIQGDYKDPKTFEALGKELAGPSTPVFYLEIPPSLFALVVEGLGERRTDRGRPGRDREAVRPRPRVREGAERRTQHPPGGAPDLPDRPLPRQGAGDGHPLPALRQHAPRADLEPPLRQLGADLDGRGLRGRGPRQLLRPGRRACATSSRTTCSSCWP